MSAKCASNVTINIVQSTFPRPLRRSPGRKIAASPCPIFVLLLLLLLVLLLLFLPLVLLVLLLLPPHNNCASGMPRHFLFLEKAPPRTLHPMRSLINFVKKLTRHLVDFSNQEVRTCHLQLATCHHFGIRIILKFSSLFVAVDWFLYRSLQQRH